MRKHRMQYRVQNGANATCSHNKKNCKCFVLHHHMQRMNSVSTCRNVHLYKMQTTSTTSSWTHFQSSRSLRTSLPSVCRWESWYNLWQRHIREKIWFVLHASFHVDCQLSGRHEHWAQLSLGEAPRWPTPPCRSDEALTLANVFPCEEPFFRFLSVSRCTSVEPLSNSKTRPVRCSQSSSEAFRSWNTKTCLHWTD